MYKVFSKNAITRFSFGAPLETGAVLSKPDIDTPEAKFPYDFVINENGYFCLTVSLIEGEGVYGLGQQLGPLNRRGKRFRLFAT